MFAKGPRFLPDKPSETPGPGHYKLPEEFRREAYKKGAFLEKTARFGIDKCSDGTAPGTYDIALRDKNTRVGSSKYLPSTHDLTHLRREVEKLKSENTRLQREHQQATCKYEEKLMHTESTVESLVKDNLLLRSQVSTQQREYRIISQRESELRAALQKIESTNKSQADHSRELATSQRKLEDLRKLHVDDRKHQCEAEHLRGELDAAHKTVAEHVVGSSVLRKQLEISEMRMKDLKKAIIGEQAEIKQLRIKLQNAEDAKTAGGSRQAELDHLKKALQILEMKHKTELSDREAKLAQQGQALDAERRQRQALELRVREAQTQTDMQVKEMKVHHRQLEADLENIRRSAEVANSAAVDATTGLNDFRTTMTRIVEEYGNLATSSVSRSVYRQLQLDYASLQLRSIRLERRLADREALTEQLRDYCRQATEEKAIRASILRDVENDFRDTALIQAALHAIEESHRMRDMITQSDLRTSQAIVSLYQTEFDDLLVAYAVAHRQGLGQEAVAARLVEACAECQVETEELRLDQRTARAALSRQSVEIAEGINRIHAVEEQLADHKRETAKLETTLRKEREGNVRLIHAVHVSKKTEEALRSEVDGLVEELEDTTRYKAAHYDLLAEVIELIRRNELAEAEAERLGKFNAEILGHSNPQQKILYVDRIRRELADTKQQLLKSTRSREDLVANNAALQHEVAAYKSIAVPPDHKVRNDRVRVERLPLVPCDINGLTKNIAFEITPPEQEQVNISLMTLDEIM